MDEITITKEIFDRAYAIADDNTKRVLDALLGISENNGITESIAPALDDYTSIRTYEDACSALGIVPFSDTNLFLPGHIIALLKLETISRALWGRTFVPRPDANGSKVYHFPWFYLYTQSEIDFLDDDEREGVLLFGNAYTGAAVGFGCTTTSSRTSNSFSSIGFRLCQENQEKARYFGVQFKELWAQYLLSI